jgi:hypothetical protein
LCVALGPGGQRAAGDPALELVVERVGREAMLDRQVRAAEHSRSVAEPRTAELGPEEISPERLVALVTGAEEDE